jgi:hypothetical protein
MMNRSSVPPISLCLLLLLSFPATLPAQDSAAVSLEVTLAGSTRDPVVRTRNLLEETPWLAALRQGLPVRLQYRLETWRSREAWLDEVERQVEWTIVVRHEPLLDQFLVTRLGPGTAIVPRRFERVLKGEIDPRSAEGGSLAQRTRRLILRLAGFPTLNLTAASEAFEVRK